MSVQWLLRGYLFNAYALGVASLQIGPRFYVILGVRRRWYLGCRVRDGARWMDRRQPNKTKIGMQPNKTKTKSQKWGLHRAYHQIKGLLDATMGGSTISVTNPRNRSFASC